MFVKKDASQERCSSRKMPSQEAELPQVAEKPVALMKC
jgi:hypothetical protein